MLPIGSIVYLNEGTNKLMILNRGPIIGLEGEETLFDYSGCFYPEGLVLEEIFYFNEENIDEVVHTGHNDEEEKRFQKLYRDWLKENETEFIKEKVEKPL